MTLPPGRHAARACRTTFQRQREGISRMSNAETLSTGQAIARSLVRNGVDTIFGIPGAHTYDFIDALYEHRDQIRFIVNRHEQGAATWPMATPSRPGASARSPACRDRACSTPAPRCAPRTAANAPVLCITGNIQSYHIGRGRGILHELPDQLAILRGLTKWSERINHPTEAAGVVGEAFKQLPSGRVRPVAIETPWDVFGSPGAGRSRCADGCCAAARAGSGRDCARGRPVAEREESDDHGRQRRDRRRRRSAGTRPAAAGAGDFAPQRPRHRRRGHALRIFLRRRLSSPGSRPMFCSASAAGWSCNTCAG